MHSLVFYVLFASAIFSFLSGLLILFYILAVIASFALLCVLLPFLSKYQLIGFYTRGFVSLVCLLGCAFYGVFASIALRLVGYGGLSQWTVARAFKYSMKWAAGLEFVMQGEEHLSSRPCVMIGNHQTELDILLLGETFPPYCSVTAKSSLKWTPILGWFMILSKTVFIDRTNKENARAAFDGAAKVMRTERQTVFIFPEGTRSYTTKAEMLPFKKGAFHLAVQAQVPIVPVVAANYSNVLNFKARIFNAGKIPLKVLPAIETTGLTPADVDNLTKTTRDQMLEELVKLTELARAQRVAMPTEQSRLLDEDSNAMRATGRQAVSPQL